MKFIVRLLIFCLVLFIYLHIYYHLKTSNDLEVYEIEQPSKDKLEEICDFRQPVRFLFNDEAANGLLENCNLNIIGKTYSAFDMKIRNKTEQDDMTELYLPLTWDKTMQLFQQDKESKYFTETNSDFLDETGLKKHYQYNDSFLRPYMVSSCGYDLISGSPGVQTPLRYELNYRNYFLVTEGSITIKLTPPSSRKYLNPISDYYNYEFRSPINPWNIQQKYKADFNKIKFLEINLNPGEILFIPAYWWYTIRIDKVSSICTFKYRTYMNTIAILPQLCMRMLQGQNVKREIVQKVDQPTLNNTAKQTPPRTDTTEIISLDEITQQTKDEILNNKIEKNLDSDPGGVNPIENHGI